MTTLDQITNLLKPFPTEGDPNAWLKEYVIAPLKVAPELEEPLRAVCSELGADQAAPASEEVKAFEETIKELKKKWTEEFFEASKRTEKALEKWKAELLAEEAKLAELKAQLDKFTSLTENHLKEAGTMKKLVSEEGVSKIEDVCISAKEDLVLQFAKAQLKLNNLKWRIQNARPLVKEKWMETLSSFKDVKLPEAIEWLVAPTCLLFTYSDLQEDPRRIDFPHDYEFYSCNTYQVKDCVLGYDHTQSLWKEEDNWQKFGIKSIEGGAINFYGGYNDENEEVVKLEISEEGCYDTHTLEFNVLEKDIKDLPSNEAKSKPVYWVDFQQKQDEEEGSITIIREGDL